jgi:hypothetical protein
MLVHLFDRGVGVRRGWLLCSIRRDTVQRCSFIRGLGYRCHEDVIELGGVKDVRNNTHPWGKEFSFDQSDGWVSSESKEDTGMLIIPGSAKHNVTAVLVIIVMA